MQGFDNLGNGCFGKHYAQAGRVDVPAGHYVLLMPTTGGVVQVEGNVHGSVIKTAEAWRGRGSPTSMANGKVYCKASLTYTLTPEGAAPRGKPVTKLAVTL